MAKTGTQDSNYDWAQKHIADFERYLTEQCQPYFEEVAAEDSSKFMAPMWWSVGYVILRGMADNQSISADDTDTLIDRSMLLLELLTYSQHPVFHEIRKRFVLPMAQALNIDKDNDGINQHILKSVAFIVFSLQDGETLTVPDLTGPHGITLKRERDSNVRTASATEDKQAQRVSSP
ncbi:hypothetical protein F4X88_10140 [Candidatus Poribacteria bacterium]|nr:hypothetical protein [Gammaproteobacteria bacterium]MXV84609.1 hypothetical protein [Candidatus Poribacteria bacterium]MYA56645.1 hypothetical protein [Candidatus Poribacteria bacterium]